MRPPVSWPGRPPPGGGVSPTLGVVGLRVVIADDHAIVAEGIASLVATTADIEVVGTAGALGQLLAVVDDVEPDVVVTDIRMPPTHTDEGIQAAGLLRERHPQTGVVVLSLYAEPGYARTLLGDGTAGRAYLLKSRVRDVDELVGAIRSVADGDSVVDPRVVDALLSPADPSALGELDHLTQREREVLAEMASGQSNASIAQRLCLSPKTIEKHVSAIFSKLGLTEEWTLNRRVVAVLAWLDGQR